LLEHNLFSNDVRPELRKRLTYEAEPPKSGYEIHPIDNEYNMPHIEWRDWSNGKANGADEHILVITNIKRLIRYFTRRSKDV
jgi:hypothetical protein